MSIDDKVNKDVVDFEKLCNHLHREAARKGFEFYENFEKSYHEMWPEYKANCLLQAFSYTSKLHEEVDCKGNTKYYNGA